MNQGDCMNAEQEDRTLIAIANATKGGAEYACDTITKYLRKIAKNCVIENPGQEDLEMWDTSAEAWLEMALKIEDEIKPHLAALMVQAGAQLVAEYAARRKEEDN